MQGSIGKSFKWLALAAAFAPSLYAQEAALRVTAFDEKTGETVGGLSPEHFIVTDDKRALRVEAVKPAQGMLDVLLLADASLVGEIVRPFVPAFIDRLGSGEQMALVTYHNYADLAQDFTAGKQLLHRAAANVRYGNAPRVLDAVFASIDGGFEKSAGRRVVMMLSAGIEDRSRSSQSEALALVREKGVSIYSVFVQAKARGLFKTLSMRSGGAYFHAKRFKGGPQALSELVFAAARGQYELTVSGARLLSNRVQVKVAKPQSKRKIAASALVLE